MRCTKIATPAAISVVVNWNHIEGEIARWPRDELIRKPKGSISAAASVAATVFPRVLGMMRGYARIQTATPVHPRGAVFDGSGTWWKLSDSKKASSTS